MKARFFLAVLVILSSRRGLAEEAEHAPAVPDRDNLLAQMAPLIASSVVRQDTAHPVFHGCYDWHSAVHGHWALLRIARVTGGHRALAEAVEKSLSAEGLAEEAKFLRERPSFEMPYGRAWFLRLAMEFELWAAEARLPDPQRLQPMADELARSILELYRRQPPDPNSREYANASWALAQLHAYAVHSRNTNFQEKTLALVREHMLEPAAVAPFRTDASQPEFFSRFGNWAYLVAKTQNSAQVDALFREHPLSEEELQPVRLLPGVHHLGMNWSRAWALRALSRATTDAAMRERLDRSYLSHLRAGMQQHRTHAGDFLAYDHWVPQFAVYALTE